MIVRGTTLMPNIHGLTSLLTLIFAPRAEFRADEKRTRLTGAICGLGYDTERKQSIFPVCKFIYLYSFYFNICDFI